MAELGKITVDPFDSSDEEQTQKAIFLCTFSMLSLLATVDGEVTKDEVQMIDKFMKTVLGLDSERRAFAIQVFNEARRSQTTFPEYAAQYHKLLRDKPKMLEWMVDILLKISCVDRVLSKAELKLIQEACGIFGISDQRLDELRAKYLKKSNQQEATEKNSAEQARPEQPLKQQTSSNSSEDSPYLTLRIDKSASNDEVQQQYKKLTDQYNPSRMVELGLPDEFVQLAEDKSRQFQKAYRAIKSERGF